MIKLTHAVLFVLCLNLASWMVVNGGFAPNPGFLPAMNFTEKLSDLQNTASNMTSLNFGNLVTLVTGYISIGYTILIQVVWYLIVGFPSLLQSFGAPTLIWVPLGVLWFTIFILFIVEMLSGRTTSGGS